MERSQCSGALASDASLAVYAIVNRAILCSNDADFARFPGFGIDLEKASGEQHRMLPVPAVFLIDADGVITFRYYNPDYRERLSGETHLEAARE